ncbi:hypothetical protein [Engelhardtia mirabilis]|uniref:hypothetical protein n=1 Tax=Engelhardtia mirabilis TaxID=2528011 RepID=UPI0011AA2D70
MIQRSIMSRYRWGTYFAALPGNPILCPAVNTGEARTTLSNVTDGAGRISGRVITLHAYTNDAWGQVGSVTIDRFAVRMGPAGAGQMAPIVGYDDSHLNLHTAAAGGAGNAGLATVLFPAVMRWIDRNLRGVQHLSMAPAGGAASKAIIAALGGAVGEAGSHAAARAARLGFRHRHAARR